MSVIRLTVVAGVLVLAGLVWLATIGFTAVVPVLVTVGALLVLVGGGNWLNGRRSPHGAAPAAPAPPRPPPPVEGGTPS